MKQTYQLDLIDRRILAQVQADASLSHAEIAERAGTSAASCWRRIRAMEVAGLLRGTMRLVDGERLGRGVNVLCNLRVRSHARDVRASFEAFVQSRPEILECCSMSGEWDYLLCVVAADVADYERFLMTTLLDHPAVGGDSAHFALSIAKYTTAMPVD